MEQQKYWKKSLKTDSDKDKKELRNFRFPRIGMRIIKSAIGIFICFLIDILRGGSGIVFYSQLAVLWCIRDYVSETKKFAIQRTIGTVLGAVWGLVIVVGNRHVSSWDYAYTHPENFLSWLYSSEIGYSILISLSIVIILYFTVLLKQKQASYFSCVVFLSIAINHVTDVNPYLFVWNRFLDTMIGIAVGVCVNCIDFHLGKNTDKLFLSGLDDTLLAPGGYISDYSRVELNRMIERGVKFTVSTIRTPASLMDPLRGINLSLPVIAMDGAALFNLADNSYEKVYLIDSNHSHRVIEYLNSKGISYFSNVVIEDVLLIYYLETEDENYNQLMQIMKKSPYRNYICREVPKSENVVYFTIIDKAPVIYEIYEEMKNNELFSKLKIIIDSCSEIEGCSLIKIYNHNASKENMLDYLKEKMNISQTVTFGTIEGKYTHCIDAGDFNRVVNIMKKESR